MSRQYEVHTSSGSIVYVVGGTSHSEDTERGTLSIRDAGYQEIAKFWNPRGFYITGSLEVAMPPRPAPPPSDDIPF